MRSFVPNSAYVFFGPFLHWLSINDNNPKQLTNSYIVIEVSCIYLPCLAEYLHSFNRFSSSSLYDSSTGNIAFLANMTPKGE